MSPYKTFWYELRDLEGIPISGATVNIFENSTLSPLNIFEIDGVTPKIQPFTTGSNGLINFSVFDDIALPSGGYKWDDELTVTWNKDTTSAGINLRQIFGEYKKVDLRTLMVLQENSIDGILNKTISNKIAYDWNSHTDFNISTSSSSWSSSSRSSSSRSSSSSSWSSSSRSSSSSSSSSSSKSSWSSSSFSFSLSSSSSSSSSSYSSSSSSSFSFSLSSSSSSSLSSP